MIESVKDTFLYFAYGSNLLKKRIHINNPSAQFLGVGRLDDHQLDFIKYSNHWKGTSATIVPTTGTSVWGAIWRIQNKDMPALDRQEGVDTNWYFPKTVNIFTSNGKTVECRTYQQTINPPPRSDNEDIPSDRRPSITYLECIINGAVECKLPEDYLKKLKKIPHNGQEAPEMIAKLKGQEN
ncbi:gamma-glutamylcyclotransferase-like [Galleria mellonella]|uniref:gamma-glutamylcyclotransferase n=1 Tax=Galleria mellonella TaxID=7137 RepID=A0A6J1WT26_GALME|nr:gamma-glutamylcyclotransferase-like [Galleria mellonella]